MLKITNMRWKYEEFDKQISILNVLVKKFKALGIKTNLKLDEGEILFIPVMYDKVFMSLHNNKIVLKPNDPRIEKRKRAYLLSKRPTLEQHNEFFNIIQTVLDSVGLYANVILSLKDRDIVLRNGEEKTPPPSAKSYPVKLIEGDVT